MAYRNKVYVAFDGDNDIRYYYLMKAWNKNPNFDFEISDAHDLHSSRDTSAEESIKRSLRERFANSKLFILLIGEHTKYLTKFVKWEIETAIRLELPIIAVNFNGSEKNDNLMPSSLKGELAVFVPYKEHAIKHAMENWPAHDKEYRKAGKTGLYYYEN